MMTRLLSIAALTTAFAAPAWAGTQTVTLSVPGMTCAACPLTCLLYTSDAADE